MFEQITMAPPDPMLELYMAYQRDNRPDKINLCIGIYQNEFGVTPILRCVKDVEGQILATRTSKSYLGIGGDPQYCEVVQKLILGNEHPLLHSDRMTTLQTSGGSAALRVAGELCWTNNYDAKIWLSDPCWANYHAMYRYMSKHEQHRDRICTYPYYDYKNHQLDFTGVMDTLNTVDADDMVVLQASCHNPSGVDLTVEQWHRVAELAKERGFLPLIDIAYQGLGDSLTDDVVGLKIILEHDLPCFVCYSFSKNMGLYHDRVGALSIVTESEDLTKRVESQAKACIRSMYSNPPAHGAAIVKAVVEDENYYQSWLDELKEMRNELSERRRLFVEHLAAQGLGERFEYVQHERGMFSLLDLTSAQIETLQLKFGIYIVNSGRISLPGINHKNVERLCKALKRVTTQP